MRRILVKSVLVVVCLLGLLIGWVAGARSLSLMLDRLHTVVLEVQPIARFGVADTERGLLQVNDLSLSTATPEHSPYPMEMKVDPLRQFVVQTGNHAIALGRVDQSLGIKPPSGDKARLQIERSWLSWPTPLAMNFMTGHAPSWKRHLYYRLVWENSDGGRLEMLWRFEQHYYDDWGSGFMTRPGVTGLIRVEIRP